MISKILLVALTVMPTAALAQFGIRMGQPLSSLQASKSVGNGRYTIMPPDPVSGFDFYQVTLTPQTGVCRLVGFGASHHDDAFGDTARARFSKLRTALDQKYGGGKEFDFIRSGALWDKPRDWTMSIKQNERTLTKYWDAEEGSTMPPGVTSIQLAVRALDSDTSYVNVTYEFSNYDECSSHLNKDDTSGL